MANIEPTDLEALRQKLWFYWVELDTQLNWYTWLESIGCKVHQADDYGSKRTNTLETIEMDDEIYTMLILMTSAVQ